MTRNFSRHEQFLRIFTLLEILSEARVPIADRTLVAQLKERLGLSALSTRTLRRDCEFLTACGYPIDHSPLNDGRQLGWQLSKDLASVRKLPSETLTLLELVAFMLGHDLLRPYEGTILWTGITSLRHKLLRNAPPALLQQLEESKRVFHIQPPNPNGYALRPRLIAAISTAITDYREIDLTTCAKANRPTITHRLQPNRLVMSYPVVQLLAFDATPSGNESPLWIDLDEIEKVKALDTTFMPRSIDVDALLASRS